MPEGEMRESNNVSFTNFVRQGFQETMEDSYGAFMTMEPAELMLLRGIIKKPTTEKIQRYANRYWTEGLGEDIANGINTIDIAALDSEQQAVNYISPWLKQVVFEASVLDRIKIEAVGVEAPAAAENALISARLERYAADCAIRGFAVLENMEDTLGRMSVALSDLFDDREVPVSWMAVKANIFLSRLSTNVRLIAALQKESKDAPELEPHKLKASNDSLFAATEAFQSYGLKSVIAPALGRNGIHEWLVLPDIINDQGITDYSNSARQFSTHPIGSFFGGLKFIDSKPQMVVKASSSSNASFRYVNPENLWGENRPLFAVELGKNGELISSGGMELDIIAKRMDCDLGLESLRSQILAIYSDLVVPVYITELYEQELRLPSADYSDAEVPTPYEGLRRIVLARQKVLTVLKDDILRDLAAQIDEVPNRQARQMAEHDVIWHIRKLPRGYRASQQARGEAAQYGVELADYGETFVQEHKRGNLPNLDKGHKAAFEQGSVTNIGRAMTKLASQQ